MPTERLPFPPNILVLVRAGADSVAEGRAPTPFGRLARCPPRLTPTSESSTSLARSSARPPPETPGGSFDSWGPLDILPRSGAAPRAPTAAARGRTRSSGSRPCTTASAARCSRSGATLRVGTIWGSLGSCGHAGVLSRRGASPFGPPDPRHPPIPQGNASEGSGGGKPSAGRLEFSPGGWGSLPA